VTAPEPDPPDVVSVTVAPASPAVIVFDTTSVSWGTPKLKDFAALLPAAYCPCAAFVAMTLHDAPAVPFNAVPVTEHPVPVTA